MKLTKNTLFAFVIISLLIIICFLWYSGIDRKPTVDVVKLYQDSIRQRDSINTLVLIDNANLSLKNSQDSIRIKRLVNDSIQVHKKYNKLRDSISPKTTTPNSQVAIFLENFNVGNDYKDSAQLPIQAVYRANITYYDNAECQEVSVIKDSIINQYIDMCLNKDKEIKNCYVVIKNDSLTKKDLRDIIYINEGTFQERLGKSDRNKKIWRSIALVEGAYIVVKEGIVLLFKK